MSDRLPLSTLLSQPLVAFTIEFDNEAEHRIPHTTTATGRTPGSVYAPWLVSMVMWFNCMRFVTDQGVSVRDLKQLARTGTNLNGMVRWGYVKVAPDPADRRPKPPQSAWLIRPRPGGRMAQQIWPALFPVIEKRWEERFGEPEIRELRESLRAIVTRLDPALPDCLPILGYGLFNIGPDAKGEFSGTRLAIDQDAKADTRSDVASNLALPSLLSRALLTFAIEFERESDVSLAISANVLRLFGAGGESNGAIVRVRDLPRLSGVPKEAIAMAVGYLAKRGYARIEKGPSKARGSGKSRESGEVRESGKPGESGKAKLLALTAKGLRARDVYFRLAPEIEKRWQSRFGEKQVRRLRASLEPLVGDGTEQGSPLFVGLEPYPDGWRAAVRRPEILPHYPMVLHRGGYPDGS